jgi:hypothetical protein
MRIDAYMHKAKEIRWLTNPISNLTFLLLRFVWVRNHNFIFLVFLQQMQQLVSSDRMTNLTKKAKSRLSKSFAKKKKLASGSD